MRRWVVVDRWLKQNVPDGKRLRFDNQGLARHLGLSYKEASDHIQAYLHEQRQPYSYTSYWLYRRGRTRNAEWIAGSRASDLDGMYAQYRDDFKRRIVIAFAPDLDRLRELNPKLIPVCDKIADALEETLIQLSRLNGKV